jgi:hypothetical protein
MASRASWGRVARGDKSSSLGRATETDELRHLSLHLTRRDGCRSDQLSDRNWKVCTQNVPAGSAIMSDTRVDIRHCEARGEILTALIVGTMHISRQHRPGSTHGSPGPTGPTEGGSSSVHGPRGLTACSSVLGTCQALGFAWFGAVSCGSRPLRATWQPAPMRLPTGRPLWLSPVHGWRARWSARRRDPRTWLGRRSPNGGARRMPAKQWSCPGVWGDVLRDPRDMAKA